MKNKKIFSLIAIVLFITPLSRGQEVYEHNYLVQLGDKAPDFEIRDTEGNHYSLSDLRGSVVMLQFTASWCSVCRKEMPFIEEEIWQEWKDEGLKVIGIDRDEPLEKVKKFKEDIQVTYPLALDPGAEIFGLFALKEAGVTRNVVIDRKGYIVFLSRLFEREEFNEMKKRIKEELDK